MAAGDSRQVHRQLTQLTNVPLIIDSNCHVVVNIYDVKSLFAELND